MLSNKHHLSHRGGKGHLLNCSWNFENRKYIFDFDRIETMMRDSSRKGGIMEVDNWGEKGKAYQIK